MVPATRLLISRALLLACLSLVIVGVPAAMATNDAKEARRVAKVAKAGSASAVIELLREDFTNDTAHLALGTYLESTKFEPRGTSSVVWAVATRKDAFAKTAAMAAFSPHAERIIGELVAGNDGAKTLAAAIIAVVERDDAFQRGDLPTVGVAKERSDVPQNRAVARFALPQPPTWDRDRECITTRRHDRADNCGTAAMLTCRINREF